MREILIFLFVPFVFLGQDGTLRYVISLKITKPKLTGIYIISLTADDFELSKKFIVFE